MDLGLAGKIALIGGASKGLGFSAARSLAREGAVVALTARSKDTLSQAAASLTKDFGSEATFWPADLSDPGQVRDIGQKILAKYGRVDILVNNAGGPPTGLFLDFDRPDWEAAFRLNLMSAVTLARELIPKMMEQRWGRIINLTSIAVKQPLDGLILSNAIRAGVHGWAKSLANELAEYAITVNNVLPGFTMTDRVRSLSATLAEKQEISPAEVIAGWESSIPMKRLGHPDEPGDLVAFLASKRASYITGTSIPVDGGFIKGLM